MQFDQLQNDEVQLRKRMRSTRSWRWCFIPGCIWFSDTEFSGADQTETFTAGHLNEWSKLHIKQMLFFLRGITLGLYSYKKLWQHFKVQYYFESCYFCRMETTLSQSHLAHLPRASVCLCALCPPVFALLCEPTQVPASGRRPRWPPLQVSCQPSRPSPEPDCQNEGRAEEVQGEERQRAGNGQKSCVCVRQPIWARSQN